MFESKMRCPCCGKCIGVFKSTETEENSITKVVESITNDEIKFKHKYVETKCPRCKKIINIYMGFKN